MAKLLAVFSTLSCDNRYADHKIMENGIAVELDAVTVKGGAGIANDRVITLRGVATMVTEKQLELLKRNSVFQAHMKNGFVTFDAVDRAPTETDAENAAANMQNRDGSAPMVDADFKGTDEDPAPTTGAGKRK